MNEHQSYTVSTDHLQTPSTGPPVTPASHECLQEILPQLRELAQKVGGFGKLAELVRQLDQTSK
jgi:hypothetical protein